MAYRVTSRHRRHPVSVHREIRYPSHYQVAKTAVSQASDIREDKVAQLKSMIDAGTYSVEPGDFASKLLEKYNNSLI